jgi:tRNA(Ile)-lysidine synthase
MQQKIQNFIVNNNLLKPKSTVIVGLSGGADSVVLLDVLISLGYNCIIAHCNFHLREDASNDDEKFVFDLSQSLQIPYHKIDFDTEQYAKTNHISIEMAARDLRYAWFYELLKSEQAEAIAVAHHADDSIETLLLNLIRGTGLRGLTGIPYRNEKIIRPLLCCNRSEIEYYILQHQLSHITDASNATLLYKRNKIRNVVLPLLEEINPSVRQTLYQNIKYFEGSFAIYKQALLKIKNEVMTFNSDLISINIDKIKKQEQLPTVLYELLLPYRFSSATIAQIVEQLDAESGKQFFSDTHRLIKDREYLLITKLDTNNQDVYFINKDIETLKLPLELNLTILFKDSNFEISKQKNCIHLDASKLNYPLQLRHWKEGDSFYPLGMDQKKKLSDFFINNKLSLVEKEKIWILLSDNEIVWIIGMRLDNRFKVSNKTEEILEIKIGSL